MLQWGHVQNDVEMKERINPLYRLYKLQWGHVQNDVEIARLPGPRHVPDGFNGATCKMTWKSRITSAHDR